MSLVYFHFQPNHPYPDIITSPLRLTHSHTPWHSECSVRRRRAAQDHRRHTRLYCTRSRQRAAQHIHQPSASTHPITTSTRPMDLPIILLHRRALLLTLVRRTQPCAYISAPNSNNIFFTNILGLAASSSNCSPRNACTYPHPIFNRHLHHHHPLSVRGQRGRAHVHRRHLEPRRYHHAFGAGPTPFPLQRLLRC